MAHSEAPQLHKICSLVKFTQGCELYNIRGIKDTPQKIYACYLANKCTKATNKQISDFFKINEQYMRHQVEYFSIDMLVDQDGAKLLEEVVNLFYELEFANEKA